MERAFVRLFNGDPDHGGIFSGTAFFIRSQQLLTAQHVITDCDNGVFVRLPPHGDVRQITSDQVHWCERDIASVYLAQPCESAQCLPLASAVLRDLDDVLLCGFYDADTPLHQRKTHFSNHLGKLNTWATADGVKPGMSGGAVIRAGELVGVIQARDEESKIITYCIPIDVIRACLGELLPDRPVFVEDEPELERAATMFVGRTDELKQLKAALLGTASTPVAITAVHGMAGVGKSWLADHFYATHRDAFPGGYQRISLNAENPISAELLLAELAERLEISAPQQSLAQLLQFRLQQPRTLLHVENVDTGAAATVAAELCKKLLKCSIVLSGRLDNFGKSRRWQQVAIKPFQTADALAQLQAELGWLEAEPLNEADAKRLVDVLGGLPLAIHLAAGYLAAGYGVDGFLHELRATGYALVPEDTTDGLYTRDQARAVLHSTFRISLGELKKQASQRQLADADQIFAHLGFAPTAGFALSMAAALTDLPDAGCESLLRLAHKLSLLEILQPKPLRCQLHPLLAAYLRENATDTGAQARLNQWFLQRLPVPVAVEGQEADYHGWHELNGEHTALSEWLSSLPEAMHTQVERAGSIYARVNGPFAIWMVFCQRALRSESLEEGERSNILFTLAYVAQRAGDLEQALQIAEAKYQLDRQRGEEREATLAKGQIADILAARGELDEALRIRESEELPVYERLGEPQRTISTPSSAPAKVAARPSNRISGSG